MGSHQRKAPLLVDALPALANELAQLLNKARRPDLAAQVPELRIVDRCNCEDDFCATFYTQPKPIGSYGPGLSCLELEPDQGMVILDVVSGRIATVEVLYRDEVRRALREAVP